MATTSGRSTVRPAGISGASRAIDMAMRWSPKVSTVILSFGNRGVAADDSRKLSPACRSNPQAESCELNALMRSDSFTLRCASPSSRKGT